MSLIKLTDKQEAAMQEHEVIHCPLCQSEVVTLVGPHIKNNEVETLIHCNTCHSMWGAKFRLTEVWGKAWDD